MFILQLLWSLQEMGYFFYEKHHFTMEIFIFGGLEVGIENFLIKVSKGTPLRQLDVVYNISAATTPLRCSLLRNIDKKKFIKIWQPKAGLVQYIVK